MCAMAPRRTGPTLRVEKELWAGGHDVVVGLDEVGRGAWAGPLTIGAAVLPADRRVNGVRDSKQLTEARREQLFDRVAGWCRAWAVGHATHEECDRLGMSAAQRLADRYLLLLPDVPFADEPGVRGDAASRLAQLPRFRARLADFGATVTEVGGDWPAREAAARVWLQRGLAERADGEISPQGGRRAGR